ncbi:MalM family protein [Vibrio sp. A1-b2]|uniref:MalM family protein n=1 Tax=Vibrio sp. A1-b2 TaxID=2912248 RepID=UPI001F011956|nr:MalM family protein [Vibrio sp. A1-b2]MCF7364443.1 MalM family protein [Vibrio sp. A1-b2]
MSSTGMEEFKLVIKNVVTAGLIVGCLSGCQTAAYNFAGDGPVEQLSSVKFSSLNELDALYVVKGNLSEINIQQNTQRLMAYGIDSPVASYELPSGSQILDLKVQAFYDAKIFAPSVLVIDSLGNIISRIPNSEFVYKPGDLFETYRQEATVRFTPLVKDIPLYVIVYTTDEDANSSSKIWIKRDRTIEEEEIVIPHSYTGRVAIEFDAFGQTDTLIFSNEDGLDLKALEYNTEKVKNLFHELRQAIKQGNPKKALDLVDKIQQL